MVWLPDESGRSAAEAASVSPTDDLGDRLPARPSRVLVAEGAEIRTRPQPECADRQLSRLAATQRGVLSHDQAVAAGLSKSAITRRLASGHWVAVLPGVYRMAGAPDSWHQRLTAASLWAGRGATISHRTAGRLHRLEGLPADDRHEAINVTVPRLTRLRAPGLEVHRSRRMASPDQSVIDGIRATSLGRTLIDLSALLDDRHLALALESGLARYPSFGIGMICRALARLKARGRTGAGRLERLMNERAPDAVYLDSEFERRFAIALRHAGLPRPREHYDVVEDGRRLAEVDFAFPWARLAIQLNGATFHRRHSVWEHDQAQLSDLAAAGWRVIHVTWSQLRDDEAAVMDRIARALDRAGSAISE